MFAHNGANTDKVTQQVIHHDSPDGDTELRSRGRSLLSSIALFNSVETEFLQAPSPSQKQTAPLTINILLCI